MGGISEVAEELGVSRQRVSQLREQPGFPPPVGEIAAGAIWDLDEIARWANSGLRRTAGRPSKPRVVLNDRYVLDDEPIGKGGFADVYRATDLKADKNSPNAVVAVKILRELTDEEVRRRFKRELRLVGDCTHSHIVPILDSGEDEKGQLWYAMPLAQGSLDEELHIFIGNDEQILRLMRQLCDGLQYVHRKGIYHRDLKPGNVLRLGKSTWAISDFGLAREAERTTTALTSTLQGVGTFFFAAPESWQGAKYAEAAADIFSLGKLVHQLVSGELPVGEPPPGRFRSIIQKATRQRPEQRYASASDMLAALEGAASAPEGWTPLAERATELEDSLRKEIPDKVALSEFMEMMLGDQHQRALTELAFAIPVLPRTAIDYLWDNDAEAFRTLMGRYATHVVENSWPFNFCDTIASFFDRATIVTEDDELLRIAVATLCDLGYGHNRYYVREVLIGVLQRIRNLDAAMSASEGLREASVSAVEWNLSDFVIRSLHPSVRATADEILKNKK